MTMWELYSYKITLQLWHWTCMKFLHCTCHSRKNWACISGKIWYKTLYIPVWNKCKGDILLKRQLAYIEHSNTMLVLNTDEGIYLIKMKNAEHNENACNNLKYLKLLNPYILVYHFHPVHFQIPSPTAPSYHTPPGTTSTYPTCPINYKCLLVCFTYTSAEMS